MGKAGRRAAMQQAAAGIAQAGSIDYRTEP
jgi:hypothetical protein